MPALYIPDTKLLGPVDQNVDNAIHWINHYPVDIAIGLRNTYTLNSDLYPVDSGWVTVSPTFCDEVREASHISYLPIPCCMQSHLKKREIKKNSK